MFATVTLNPSLDEWIRLDALRVGGLADTVVDVAPQTTAAAAATGFVLNEHTPSALVDAVRRAVAAFQEPRLWRPLMQTGMRQDFSWSRSARAYVDVYERALSKTAQGSRL